MSFLFLLACLSRPDRPGADQDDIIGLLVTPDGLILPVGESTQLTATGLLSDRSAVDYTASARWTVQGEGIVTVSDALDSEGVITALDAGVAQVWAEVDGVVSPVIDVTVTAASLERLTVSPSSLSLVVGDEIQLSATARFSDGASGDVSGQARWITGDGGVAQLDGEGVLDAVGQGDTSVHAEYEGLASDEIPVVVAAAGSTGQADLDISAASGSVSGGTLDLSVTLHNGGDASASGFWVDVFVDPDGAPQVDDVGDDYLWIDYLGPDSSDPLEFQLDVSSGDHTVWIYADTNDDVAESDESDNTFSTTVGGGGGTTTGGPDLVVDYFDYIAYDGEVYYYVDVLNQGDEDAGWFYVDLFLDESSAPGLYEDGDDYTSMDALAAGELDYADFLIESSCDGCSSWVLLDGYDTIDEVDEDNNVGGPLEVWAR